MGIDLLTIVDTHKKTRRLKTYIRIFIFITISLINYWN